MRANDSARGLSSPCSTNGGASPNGSPETKLTVYSPEDIRSQARSDQVINGPSGNGGYRKLYAVATSSDPFLMATSTRAQLSPTAASFTPTGVRETGVNKALSRSSSRCFSSLSYLSSHPDSDSPGPRHGPNSTSQALSSNYGVIGDAESGRRDPGFRTAVDSIDGERRSRALVIKNVPANLTYMSLAGFFSRREFGTLKSLILAELNAMGKVYVAFADSREAKRAMEKVHLLRPEWRVFPLTAKEYAQHSDTSLLSQTSDYEGQLVVTIYYDGRNPALNQHSAARSLETIALTFGDVKEFSALPTGQENISEFLVEFFNTRDSDSFLTTLNGTAVDDYVLEVSEFKPDVNDKLFPPHATASPVRDDGISYDSPHPKSASLTPSRAGHALYMELSPTGRSTVPPGEHAGLMDWMSRAGEGVSSSSRRESGRYADMRLNNQNAVDVERIRLGLDVRTTIMLRNIPNKIDQTMLKAIVDESSHGKYDFMYLRIDFANNCNVGYAFINFEDPIDIIDFVKMRAGRTWNCFNSDKVAEVSYATIQGKDCLVQKFRNSSVMLEHPSFRPKIFHTGTGPLAGTEDRFPGPDNPSKMRRSIENAEHVGLFAPRVGQQYRDEQRRRRSQFDRGTTAAEREIIYVRTLGPRSTSGTSSGLRSAPCTYPGMKTWFEPTLPDRGPRTS
ncbi:RNA recognition motif 2-domain-containing protein [Aspergillus ambiguus]|uniref:putative meiosis protein MEI2 n=1 Tax=Aspergillus ambiguus TaxID=176160 RepID=UPI003CCD30B6